MPDMSETRTIRDLQFWYREAFDDPYTDQTLVREKIATRGETITITHPEDLRRGDEAGSFYTDAELDAGAHLRPANQFDANSDPNPEIQDPNQVPETPAPGTEAGSSTPASAPNLSEDSVDDIAAWMTAEHPNVSTVLELAYQYKDDEDAMNKLLDAEDQSTGDEARKSLVEGVQKIMADNTQ